MSKGKLYLFNGKMRSLRSIANEIGINPTTFWSRIAHLGWSLDEAINTPVTPSHHKKYRFNGQVMNLKQISEKTGVDYTTLRYRVLQNNWSITKAIETPVQEQNAPSYITGTKKCPTCKKVKPISEFYRLKRRTGNEFQPACKDCNKKIVRERRQNIRLRIIDHYSNGTNQCELCHESRVEALDIDHIDGNGNKDRKEFGHQYTFHKWIINNNFPSGYRILCRNCNWIEQLKLYKRGIYSE